MLRFTRLRKLFPVRIAKLGQRVEQHILGADGSHRVHLLEPYEVLTALASLNPDMNPRGVELQNLQHAAIVEFTRPDGSYGAGVIHFWN